MGRGVKPPPQLGQTLLNTFDAQSSQNVHSKLHIKASVELYGRAFLQFSQTGLNSSIVIVNYWVTILQKINGNHNYWFGLKFSENFK